MKKKIYIISIIILIVLSSSGCGEFMQNQTVLNKLDNLGFHDYYAVMPSGELNIKLKEKGYILLDEYKSKKLYVNLNVKDKYLVTTFQSTNSYGFYRVGWRIIAIDEQIPEAWEGKQVY